MGQVFTETKIDFVDFRSINICNFKCRSCNPVFSNGIAQESNRNPDLQKFYRVGQLPKTLAVDTSNTDWILHNLPVLKRVMFTGGEPTCIPEVRCIIEQIRQHHPHIQILITSNASFEDDFWLDISSDLNVHWTVSIDAVGPRASVIRHGSDWPLIEKNVISLCETANSVSINSVISNLSLFGLRPLLQFACDMRHRSLPPHGRHGDQGCRHQFYVCEKPYYLAANNWPESIQPQALSYVQSCLDLDLNQEQKELVRNLAQSIEDNQFNQFVWDSGQRYNGILDRIRHEDHNMLFQPQV
jgi:sulfatase maturation enzyme AslB (radical SAM superfamily)